MTHNKIRVWYISTTRQHANVIVRKYNIAGKCIYVQGNQNEGGAKSAKMHGVQWYSYIIHKTVMTLQRTIKACYIWLPLSPHNLG